MEWASSSDILKLFLLKKKLSIKTRNYVTSKSLRKNVDDSDWNHFYLNADDLNFVAVTSLTREGFERLLKTFKKHYRLNSGRKGGRPNRLVYHQVLGLVLVFYCDTIAAKNLCQMFAIPPATLSRTLLKAEEALQLSLKELIDARIVWPTLSEQREWGEKVSSKNSLIKGRWGFIDGKNYRVQTPSEEDKQNAYYIGWLHCVYVTGCICFGVDGCIVWYRHNCPGSWNDGETSRQFQQKLCNNDKNLPGHGVLSDSAFPVSDHMFGKIITPLKENDLERAPPGTVRILSAVSNAITSMRQAAEWGMGAVEKVYRRLLQRLPYNQKRRSLRIKNLFKLYNFRVRTTKISQIRTYFNSTY